MDDQTRARFEDFLSSPLGKFRPWVTPDGRSPQRDFIRGAGTHKARILRAGNRTGKAQPVDEPVLTPQGWRPIGDLRINDSVIAGDGSPVKVTAIHPQGIKAIFRLTFNDGSWTRCCDDHLWRVKDRNGRFAPDPSRHSDPSLYGQWKVMPLHEIRERWGDRPRPINRVTIPTTEPVLFAERAPLRVDPYVLGVILGDGCISHANSLSFTSADHEIAAYVEKRLPEGQRLACYTPSRGKALIYRFNVAEATSNHMREALEHYALLGTNCFDKFVPDDYLFASPEDRLEILRGLLDTDGTCGKKGNVEFSTTSRRLADAVQFLVQSLGGKSTIRTRVTSYSYLGIKKQGQPSFRVGVRLRGVNPFRLARKAARYKTECAWTYDRALVSVDACGEQDAVCIEVDHPERTYLTRHCIVTHNSYGLAWDHVAIASGMHPFYPKKGPTKGWIIAPDWAQGIGTVIWPRVKKFLTLSQVTISYLRRSAPEIPSTVTFRNGSTIQFKSADAGPSKFAGADLDWVWVDEEVDASIVEEARMRLVDRGGLFSVSLTPVTSMKWISDLEGEKDKHGNPSTLVVRASMRDAMEAGVIDRDSVERVLANLPEWKRRLRELGDFSTAEGLVYPAFSRLEHCLTPRNGGLYDGQGRWVYPWPLPKQWPRYASMDFGYTVPSAVVIAAEDPYSQRLVVERVLYASEIRMSRWAEALRGTPDHPALLPKLEAPMIADWDAMERAELAAAGIPTCSAKKDKIPGIEAVERSLGNMADGKPRIQFVLGQDQDYSRNFLTGRDDAYHLIWEMERYRYPERKERGPDVKDEPIKKDDHLMDALRYLAYFLERRNAGNPLPLPNYYPDKPNPLDGMAPPNPWKGA